MGLFKFIKDAGAKLFGGAQAATPDTLKQPNMIQPGWVLRIPPLTG
jgi:nucleoid-associated protein YgaU